jgi:hypothetical protein
MNRVSRRGPGRAVLHHAMQAFLSLGAVFLGGIAATGAWAQGGGFSALISPPRVETNAKPGQTTRQVLEVTQVGPATGRFRVYTLDWSLNPGGGVDFSEELKPGSCRPWVALEKRELTVAGNSKVRFRFEITPPADAAVQECRFAIMFEGLDASTSTGGLVNFPVSGRIGVIVYANMAGARPELKILSQDIGVDAAKLPTLVIQNDGNAHGRLVGLLRGTDDKGVKLEFTPSSLPILPGESRAISLTPNVEGGGAVKDINYPVTIKGALEWGGQRVPFEHTFSIK